MLTDRVVVGEKIGAGIEVEVETKPIRLEIGIRLEAKEGLAAVLVVVTKIGCICRYEFDIFTPVCGVFLQTIIGVFGDLFGGLLLNTIIVISGFINKLCCRRGDETIDGYYNKYFNDGLYIIHISSNSTRKNWILVCLLEYGGLRTAIYNKCIFVWCYWIF